MSHARAPSASGFLFLSCLIRADSCWIDPAARPATRPCPWSRVGQLRLRAHPEADSPITFHCTQRDTACADSACRDTTQVRARARARAPAWARREPPPPPLPQPTLVTQRHWRQDSPRPRLILLAVDAWAAFCEAAWAELRHSSRNGTWAALSQGGSVCCVCWDGAERSCALRGSVALAWLAEPAPPAYQACFPTCAPARGPPLRPAAAFGSPCAVLRVNFLRPSNAYSSALTMVHHGIQHGRVNPHIRKPCIKSEDIRVGCVCKQELLSTWPRPACVLVLTC